MKKYFGDTKLGFLQFSQVCIVSFPWYYTELQVGQCLTSSWAETSKKNCGPY